MNSSINSYISEVIADEQRLKGYIKSFVNYVNTISGIPEFYVRVISPVPCILMVLANKEYVNALDGNKDIKEISSQKVLKAILKSVTI